MNTCERQFVSLLKAAITNREVSEDLDWQGLWKLALRHHLEALVYDMVKSNMSVPAELLDGMEKVFNQMLARDIRQNWCLTKIEEALSSKGIGYAPIKGAILKNDYTKTYHRFMSDLDFYICPEDRPGIRSAVEQIDGRFRGTESGDEQFLFWNEIGVEFHGRLLYKKNKNRIENYPAWQYVNKDTNRLSEEGFALNLIGHAVHDLASSGPGIRYILDLWIYKNKHDPQPDWEYVEATLKSDGIFEAAHNLLELSEYLFGEGKPDELKEELAEYVLQGGLHGDYKRALTTQVAGGNAIFKQIFRNRSEYVNRYPWLKKYPFLLPVAWVKRLSGSLTTHKKAIRKWYKGVSKVSNLDAKKQQEKLRRFGL